MRGIPELGSGRRRFLKSSLVTAAGVITLAGAAPEEAYASGIVEQQLDPKDAEEYPVPKGMKKNAQIDARYQISYKRSVPAACRVLTAHFDAISQRDYAALADTMHFPFAIVERIDPVVVKAASELTNRTAPPSLNFSPTGEAYSDHFSYLAPGAYDMLISLEVINFDPVHVNMAMTFDRFNQHGRRVQRCDGVYCVTNNDGKWAIQLMSTIWTPDDFIGKVYSDAVEAAMRNRINHNLSYIDDNDIIDRPRPNRSGSVGISGGGIGNLFASQQGDDPLAQFKIKGVKSRLSTRGEGGGGGRGGRGGNANSTANPMDIDPIKRREDREPHVNKNQPIIDSFRKQGDWDYLQGVTAPASRIIHHVADKAHRYAGAARYSVMGEMISCSMEVAVVVLGTGAEWTNVASLRYVTTHDLNNDDRRG